MTINMIKAQSEIQKVMEEYQKRLQWTSSESAQEIEAPVEGILSTYFKVFKENNKNPDIPKNLPSNFCYDVGIFLVGYSSIPIVLSIAGIQPRQEIYFLYSTGTDYIVVEIQERIEKMLGNDAVFKSLIKLVKCADNVKVDNPSDPVATFKQIKGIINKVGDKRIALDLTGGKKPMLGGGFTAAAILRFADSSRSSACDMFYVDSAKYDEGIGAPEPGTEFLTQLKNPYDIYNVQSTLEAEKLFKEHNYKAAADLWKGIGENLRHHATVFDLKTEFDEAVNHYRMADFYHFWDAFYYDLAQETKNCHEGSWGYIRKHTQGSIDVLKILSQVSDRKTLFEKQERIIHYAVDRYQNAIRRKDSGKLEDAIVRFTQVVEMLCVYRIYQQYPDLVVADRSGVSQKRCPDPNNDIWRITPLIKFLFGQLIKKGDNPPTRPKEVDSDSPCNVYTKDGDFYWFNNPPLCIKDYSPFCVDEITDLIEYRNEFIHVTRAMRRSLTEKNTQKLQELALKFLANFSKDYHEEQCLCFKNLLKLHRIRFQRE